MNAQFAVNVFEMRRNRRGTETQGIRNLDVLFAAGGEDGDLTFAQSQCLPTRVIFIRARQVENDGRHGLVSGVTRGAWK